MAERRESGRSAEDEPLGDAADAAKGARDRRRRSEMSRRELRQRTRRAKRAAREGTTAPPRRRRTDARPRDDVDRVQERIDAVPDQDLEPSPDDAKGDGSDEETVGSARLRGRRRSKRRDREPVIVQHLEPSDADERRDRISGEVLFAADVTPGEDAGEDAAGVAAHGAQGEDDEVGGDAGDIAGDADGSSDAEEDGDDVGTGAGVEAEGDDAFGGGVEPDRDVDVPRERGEGDGDPVETGRDAFRGTSPSTTPRRTSRLVAALLALVALVVLGIVATQLGWLDLAGDMVGRSAEEEAAPDPPADGWQPTFLLASVDDHVPGGELRSLAVLATDRRDDRGTMLLVPTTVVADVPGFGSFTLREAWELGGSSLVAVTVDNLLGLHIDGVLAVDRSGWASWFEPIDGADLTVRSRIVPREGHDGQAIEPGTRKATPDEVAGYAAIHGEGETELDVLPRTRQVLDTLFEAISEDPSVLDAVVDAARTFPGTATPDRIRTVMGELADHRERDALTSVSLPVIPLGSGDDDLYRSDDDRLSSVIDERFAASREDRAVTDRLALQILNGNGRPGVGQEVAEQLADGSYRIVLTGNADRFTYDTTRIVVYSEDAEVLRAAQDIQEWLGNIGTIERAATPQSVVDVTIVVGHDFPP